MQGRGAIGLPARTILEQKIRERRQTFEEFAEYAETFARQHGEPGTLSVRHLQRLVAGRRSDGSPLGPMRPATARLLERIFGISVVELLAPPAAESLVRRQPDAPKLLRVAISVVLRGAEVLVVRRRGDVIAWQFPAGMVKPGLALETVAVRETLRETDVHCVVREPLGSRLHPVTQVLCHYMLCDYVAGEARNVDAFENVDVAWVNRQSLGGFIPVEQVYRPVLQALV